MIVNIYLAKYTPKYPVLILEECKKIPLNKICKPSCLIFFWVTVPILE